MTKPKYPDNDTHLSTGEAAARLGVSLRTIQLWSEQGRFKIKVTPGGHRRILATSVAELEEQMKQAGQDQETRELARRAELPSMVRSFAQYQVEAFEAHIAKPSGMDLTRNAKGEYDHASTLSAWNIWCAAAAWRLAALRRFRVKD